MIPVLGVPYINRKDLLVGMLESVNQSVEQLIIIDNSPQRDLLGFEWPNARVISMGHNLGVAASWNLIIKVTPLAPWWLITNSDIVFGPNDLASLTTHMGEYELATMRGMAVFAIRPDAIEKAGWFDEGYLPAYCEDNDYSWRCQLTGVKSIELEYECQHVGSAVIGSEPRYRSENNRTYPQNVLYYERKWGGIMGKEVYRTPFNKGGDPREWTLSPVRLAELTWKEK